MYARAPLPKRNPPPPDGSTGMPRWPASIAILAIGALYFLVPARVRIGPPWLVFAIGVIAAVTLFVLRRLGMHLATRNLAIALTITLTLAISTSAVFLVTRLPGGKEPAPHLLREAALVWVLNVLIFALWYWEIDGGGPHKRQRGHHASSDFVFPQMALSDDESMNWSPDFLDYLFLSFNTSTAFSPTDTLVLSRVAKVLMMYQAAISLVIISVLIARGINTLQ
jgi:hypothetical protein